MASASGSSTESSDHEHESGSEISLSDSDSSTASSDEEIAPYRYEPDASGEEEEGGDAAVERNREAEERLENNLWCSCSGGCAPMPIIKECLCCKEVPQVVQKMDDVEEQLDCIIQHPGFGSVCLDVWVLETAYYQYRQQYGGGARADATANEKNRHVAYRQLARWCWGFLGRAVRVPLPSCAVLKIREMFPSEEYRGFQEL